LRACIGDIFCGASKVNDGDFARRQSQVALSVCIITYNEEAHIARTLDSVKGIADEMIVVDSGSTDKTVELARARGAKVFVEEWRGFSKQKNAAMAKASGDWILSLDADEEVSPELAASIQKLLKSGVAAPECDGYIVGRKNFYLNRWLKRSGYYPDRKLRLVRRGMGEFEDRAVHESMHSTGKIGRLEGDLIHHAYATLESFVDHANRYSSLGGQMEASERRVGFSVANIVLRPLGAFIYRYFFRVGFLDGREGLLVHLNHAAYVSWKYAKAWEYSKNSRDGKSVERS
jgi:glycosyltransferase involved in cell wall biosynthesis